MTELEIIYKQDGEVRTEEFDDVDWFQVLVNLHKVTVDGNVFTRVIEVKTND